MLGIFSMAKKRNKSKVKRYPTDLNDKKWGIINLLLPEALSGGRPREVSLRKIINAIFYITRGGCAWRLLPHEFPAWQTVYGYYRVTGKRIRHRSVFTVLYVRMLGRPT